MPLFFNITFKTRMRTKARIILRGEVVPHYSDWSADQYLKVNREITEKVRKTIVELPCRPNKGDRVNLKTFKEKFALNKLECECLDDVNYLAQVVDIEIRDGHLDVHVKKIE